ncbi:MAG: dihydrofolate reductase [Gammaproteobacteria bacterium]|nr:dihydrofolate reductase [Gammaproteobacteria bacterium]
MAPLVSIIAAVARNRIIGTNGGLPWHLPADLKRFKKLTMGKPMIMGRRTWESLPGLLPGRPHIVVSRGLCHASGCIMVRSPDEAVAAAGDVPELMVIGGAALYQALLPRANRLYLTRVHADIDGDTCFPIFDEGEWCVVERIDHPRDDAHFCPLTFQVLARKRGGKGCQPLSA